MKRFARCLVLIFGLAITSFGQTNTNLITKVALPGSTNVVDVTTTTSVRRREVMLTFGLDRIEPLRKPFGGVPIWQYLASLIYVFAAFYISKAVDYFVGVHLKKWASKTATKLDDLIVELMHGPIKVVVFVVFLHLGLQAFQWPDLVERWLSKALQIVVAASLTYMLLKLIDMCIGYWRQRAAARDGKSFNDQLFPIISKTLKTIVVIAGVLVTCDNLGIKITSLLAGISVGGLAVGLAAQDTVANLFGAVAVFVDKPFGIGDYVKLGDVEGAVETIGLRSTQIRNPEGHLITVPNKTMGNATITNVTRRPTIKTTMNIGITYDTPTEKVKLALSLLDQIYRAHPMTDDLIISFNKFADSALNFQVIHWWKPTDYKTYMAGMQELNLAIKEKFDGAGIGFAFPSQTLYIKQDSNWRMEKPAP